MITRRQMMRIGAGATLFAPFAGFTAPAAAQGAPLFRFGVVTDPQYAPVPPRGTRFYANTLWKLQDAVAELNRHELRFVVTLGDIIDRHWESYSHILPVYDRLTHPHFFVLGNHDYEVGRDYLHAVRRVTGLARTWYDFEARVQGGPTWRFVVLDGNDISLFANAPDSAKHAEATRRLAALREARAENAQPWNGGFGPEQLEWLTDVLRRADVSDERVVLMNHYPVFPANIHNMWNWEQFMELIGAHRSVVAFLNGHNHAGNYGTVAGKHFLNLKGMVETASTTAYSVFEVHANRLEVKPFGVEDARTLSF